MKYKESRGKRIKPAQTTLKECLEYALYLNHLFYLLTQHEGVITFNAVDSYEEQVQAYLSKNAHRNSENRLFGIMAVIDSWPNATGGRNHMYMGGRGPLIEILENDLIIVDPVDYENKDLIIRKIFYEISGLKAPDAGNAHVHPHLCITGTASPNSIREELSIDHGLQNATLTQADLKFFLLDPRQKKWTDAIAIDMQMTFGRKV